MKRWMVAGWLCLMVSGTACAQQLYYVDSTGMPVVLDAHQEGEVIVLPQRGGIAVDGATVDGESLVFRLAKARGGYVDGRRVTLLWGYPERVIQAALENRREALARLIERARPRGNERGAGPEPVVAGRVDTPETPDTPNSPNKRAAAVTAVKPPARPGADALSPPPALPAPNQTATAAPGWEIRIEDERIADALARWARESGGQFALRWDAGIHIPVQAAARFGGRWDEAVAAVIDSVVAARPDQGLRGCIYEGNAPVLVLITTSACSGETP